MKNWEKTFLIIWSGQLASSFSSAIVGHAIILRLGIDTRSAGVLALAYLAALLPQALVAPLAGVCIDRWDRKKVMILSDLFIALVTLVAALVLARDGATSWIIYLLLALRSAGTAFHAPAISASIPLLVPGEALTRVAGINQAIQAASNLAGPIVAALLIAFMEIHYILLFDIAGALLACATLGVVTIPSPGNAHVASLAPWREAREGLEEIIAHRGIALLMVISVLSSACLLPLAAIYPLMTLEHFGGTPFLVGMVEVGWGGGMLLGGVLLGTRRGPLSRVLLVNAMQVLLGATLALSGLLPPGGYLPFVVLAIIGGASASVHLACLTALIQREMNPGKLGRVFSLYASAGTLFSIPGLLCTGVIVEGIGLTVTFVLLGGAIMLSGILSFLVPAIRQTRESE